MARASSSAARDVVLIDAGPLGGVQPAPPAGAWPCPDHHLDTAERLAACHGLVRERRPDARVHVFLDQEGFCRLRAAWRSGSAEAGTLRPPDVQCVPFGCKVCDFLLELMQRRVAEGCHVTVVSNTPDVVLGSRACGQRVAQLGFMFIEGDIVVPGLAANAPAGPSQRRSGRGGPPVQRTIAKPLEACPLSRPLAGRCGAGARSANGGSEYETLHDSQLDGVALDEDFADTLVDFGVEPAPLAALADGLEGAGPRGDDAGLAETRWRLVPRSPPRTPRTPSRSPPRPLRTPSMPSDDGRSPPLDEEAVLADTLVDLGGGAEAPRPRQAAGRREGSPGPAGRDSPTAADSGR